MRNNYFQEAEVENALAVVANWIADDYGVTVNYHNGMVVAAEIFKKTLHIPHMATASGIGGDCLQLLRARIGHEAGHILTNTLKESEYPKGPLHEIWNSLVDRYMEREIGNKYLGMHNAFRWKLNYYNRKITEDLGKDDPIVRMSKTAWEALVYMSMLVDGVEPLWTPTAVVRVLVDAAYDEYYKVWKCKSDRDCLTLAKKILEIFKDVLGDMENQQFDPSEGSSQQGDGEKSDEPQQSNGESSSKQEEKDEDGDKSEGSSDGDGEPDDESGSSEGNEFGDEEDEDEEGSYSDGSGKSDEEGSDKDGGIPSQQGGKKKGKYHPNTTERDGEGTEESDLFRKAFEGKVDLDKLDKEELSKAIKQGDVDPNYTSDKSRDEHVVAEQDRNTEMASFKTLYESVSTDVMAMSRELQQALRSMARCRKQPFQRIGKIDGNRMVQIAKNTSKSVYYTKKDGFDVDTAVVIIIDESGSMGSIARIVQKVVAAVGESVDGHVPFMVVGTTTKHSRRNAPSRGSFSRTNPIMYKHYKGFNESWSNVRHRVTNISSISHNVDGEVVEYAAHMLKQRPERRKIILSICDGCPVAGHDNNYEMGENLKRVCKRSRKQGVEVYGFGINTSRPQEYYGKEWFVRLEGFKMDAPFVRRFAQIVTKGRFAV